MDEDHRDELYLKARQVADEINRRVDDFEAWPDPFAIPATGQARISVSVDALRAVGFTFDQPGPSSGS